MTGKWTPGPWVVVVGDDDDVTVCAFEGDPRDGIMSDVICEITSINDVSDPHLIAGAPALYEALEWLLASYEADPSAENYPGDREERLTLACGAARIALSQALGEGE